MPVYQLHRVKQSRTPYSTAVRVLFFPHLYTEAGLVPSSPFTYDLGFLIRRTTEINCLVFRKTKDLYLIITRIQRISWNPWSQPPPCIHQTGVFAETLAFIRFWVDFTGEICWISWVKSARFHGWNPPDFKGEIRRISKDELPGMVSPMFIRVSFWQQQTYSL